MIEKTINILIDNKIIVPEDKDIYQYGLALFVKKAFHTLIILLIGFITGEFWEILAFLIAYASIRKYAGGYHAKTEIGCYCCTITVTILVFLLLKIFQNINTNILWLFLIICGTIIYSISPIEAINKPLENHEKSFYKKRHMYI